MDMGPMGTYQIFNINGVMAGGMASANAESRIPLWRYYINVADIDAAVARITAAGGTILLPPHAVPGGSWIVHGLDPQGAFFALAGPRV
jgi:predicted enzyme related to lactoylglutathione lyase